MRNKKVSAFSLFKMSIAILIIGILTSGIVGGGNLIAKATLNSARSLTKSSPIVAMKKGLILWMDTTSDKSFKTSVTGNDDLVDTWYDLNPITKPSSAIQNTAGYKPKYIEKGINGLPALKFDGVDDYMAIGTPFYDSLYPKATNSFAMFVVAQATTSHEVDVEASSGTLGNSGEKYLLYPTSGTSYANISNAAGAGISFGNNGISVYEQASSYLPPLSVYSSSTTLSNPVIILVEYNNKTPAIYVNGTLVHTGLQSSMSYIFPPIYIGGSSYGFFQGYVGEIIMFNRTLTSDEKSNVTDYLKNKWRISS